MPDADKFCAVREEIAELGLREPTFGHVEGVAVKVGVVGGNGGDVVALEEAEDVLARLVEIQDFMLTAREGFEVLRDFLGIVGRGHELALLHENIRDEDGAGFVDTAQAVTDGEAEVIDEGIIGRVGGLDVEDEVKLLCGHGAIPPSFDSLSIPWSIEIVNGFFRLDLDG